MHPYTLFFLMLTLCGCASLNVSDKNKSSGGTLSVLPGDGEAKAGFSSGSGSSIANSERVGIDTYAKPALTPEELLACGISDSKLVDPQPIAERAERYQRMQMELEKNITSAAPPKTEHKLPLERDLQSLKERLKELEMYFATKRPKIVRVGLLSNVRDDHLNAYVKQVTSHVSKSIERLWPKTAWQDQAKVRFALQLDDTGRIYTLAILRKSGHDDLDFEVVQALCEAQPYPNRVHETEIDLVEFVRTATFEKEWVGSGAR